MSTLQGIISNCVDNANIQADVLGHVTTNTANYNTVGYKSERFEDYLVPDGRIEGVRRYDYSQGSVMVTQRPLDVAVDGAGFIQVTSKDGQTAYTRDGSFKVDSKGYLVTSDGYMVGDGISIPAGYESVKIDKDGTVKVLVDKDTPMQVLGKIPLVIFNNPEGLKSIESNKVVATPESGDPILQKDTKNIKQACLERSNANMFNDVSSVLKLNASMIASIKLIKVVDDVYMKSINLHQ